MILRELLATFGIDFDTKQLSAADRGITGLIDGVKALGAVVAGNQIIQGIRSFADELNQTGSEIHDTADSLGVTTDALQELRYAAHLSGTDVGGLNVALQSIQRTASQAAEGGKGQATLFRRLGVDTRDASGQVKDAATLFTETGEAISRLKSDSEKTRYAMALFGRQGRTLLPLFKEGKDGVAALRREFHELGGGLSQELIADADKYGDQIDRLNTSWTGLKSLIGVYLLPVLTALVTWGTEMIVRFHDLVEGTHAVQLAMVALGIAAAATGVAMLLPFAETLFTIGLVVVAVGAVILVVDDLITLFEGGDSVIGEFLDQLLGLGGAAFTVATLKTGWEELLLVIDEATEAVERFFGKQGPDRRPEFAARQAGIDVENIIARTRYAALEPQRQAAEGPGGVSTVNRQAIIDAAAATRTGATPGRSGTAPRRVPAPARPSEARSVTIQSPTSIVVPGAGDPEAVAARVERRIVARRDAELRQAHEALTQGSEETG